jgi:hypothetical protein
MAGLMSITLYMVIAIACELPIELFNYILITFQSG